MAKKQADLLHDSVAQLVSIDTLETEFSKPAPGGYPEAAAAKPVAPIATATATKKAEKRKQGRPQGKVTTAELEPMQFRMPPDFARNFRTEAVQRGMKYNEFLEACFAAFMKAAK